MPLSSPIEHVVVLMLENRSFDHLLGMLPGVDGVLAKNGLPDPQYFNLEDPANPGSSKYPAGAPAQYVIPKIDIGNNGFGGPGHSFADALLQLDSKAATAADVPSPPPLDGFVANYVRELRSGAHRSNPAAVEIREPMTSFTTDTLPVLTQLAAEFCVCDRWFSEVPGPTQPNRLFAHAATSTGLAHNVWDLPIDANTIYQELDKVGQSWAFFYFDLSDSNCFPALKSRTDRILKFDAFYQQATAGSLPAYSFLCPQYSDGKDGSRTNSEHPPYDIRYGEVLIADVYEALRASPAWEKTLLIVTYDEHGGYFDHVAPPAASNPDGLTSPTAYDQQQAAKDPQRNGYLVKPNMTFDFNRLGLRVPAVLISPWIPKGSVDSTPYQHTSIFATLRDLFGVGTLTKRDAEARSFAPMLSKLKAPRTDAPLKLNRPALPASNPADMQKPVTDRQHELWPMLSHLDGHPDSGSVTKPPHTRAAAADYIQERLAAHHAYHAARRRQATYQVHSGADGKHHWQLHDGEGHLLAQSARAYDTPEDAERDIERLRDIAPAARQARAHAAKQ